MTKNLTEITKEANIILQDKLKNSKLVFDFAEIKIPGVKSVGVQGDNRTYEYVAEVYISLKGRPVYNPNFLADLSSTLTNQVKNINRVVYVLGIRD